MVCRTQGVAKFDGFAVQMTPATPAEVGYIETPLSAILAAGPAGRSRRASERSDHYMAAHLGAAESKSDSTEPPAQEAAGFQDMVTPRGRSDGPDGNRGNQWTPLTVEVWPLAPHAFIALVSSAIVCVCSELLSHILCPVGRPFCSLDNPSDVVSRSPLCSSPRVCGR